MADNVLVSTAGGNETLGADEISSIKYQRAKLIYGPDGINSGDVQEASTTVKGPLPTNAYHASDYLVIAGLGIAPTFASFALAASGDLVAAQTSKRIRLISLFLVGTTAGTIKFQSGASSDLSGVMTLSSGVQFVLPFNPIGWMQTVSGEKLNLVIATTNPVSGCLAYIAV